jgi:hypothetical protein
MDAQGAHTTTVDMSSNKEDLYSISQKLGSRAFHVPAGGELSGHLPSAFSLLSQLQLNLLPLFKLFEVIILLFSK